MRRLLVFVLVASGLVLAACAGGSGGGLSDDRLLPPSVAADLAGRSETVARLLEAGEPCEARRQARGLAGAVERAARVGSIPPSVEAEINPVVASLVADINCQPVANAPAETAELPASGETTDTEEAADGEGTEAGEDDEGDGNDKPDKDKDKDPHDNGHGNDDNKGKQ